MKKKILSVAIVVILVAALAIGGTLAYMTDRDDAKNTFTVGNVSIDLQEVYVANSQLMPGVTIDKDITIANDGINDAWVWYTYAVPTELVPYLSFAFEGDGKWYYHDALIEGVVDEQGVEYTVFTVMYLESIANGEKTEIGMTSVTLSPYIDVDPDGYLHSVIGGVVTDINWTYDVSPVIYVNAYAIQKDTFNTVHEAYNAYIGQWGQLQLSWEAPQQ